MRPNRTPPALSGAVAALFPLAAFTSPACAGIAVAFSNLDANGTSTGSSTIVGGTDNFFSSVAGARFTMEFGSYSLGTIDVVIDDHDGDNAGSVRVSLRADNAGLPGAILETLPVYTGPLVGRTTLSFVSDVLPFLEFGESYWVTVTSADPNGVIRWANNSVGDDRIAAIDFGHDDEWELTENADPAFRIWVIPTPGPAALLAAGALFATRRRR